MTDGRSHTRHGASEEGVIEPGHSGAEAAEQRTIMAARKAPAAKDRHERRNKGAPVALSQIDKQFGKGSDALG